MKREEVKAHLRAQGWTDDPYGHMKCTRYDGIIIRMKMCAKVVRREMRVVHKDNSKSWLRTHSAYYGQIGVSPDGKLTGFCR